MIRFTLDKVMKERGLTQSDVIDRTGVTRNTVKALVANANTRIDFPTLNALCNGLGVSPADLIEHLPD